MGKQKKTPGGKVWHDWASDPEQEQIHEEKMRLAETHGIGNYSGPDDISNRLRDIWRKKEERGDKPSSVLPFSECYLTTACTDSMDLPDNCFELETLRAFRDKIMMPTQKGRKGIADYKVIAPEIVQAVNETEGTNARKVWQALYGDVAKAVNLIIIGDFEGAFEHYKQMTLKLKSKYLD